MSLNKRTSSEQQSGITAKILLAQQPQHDFGDQDEEPRAEGDYSDEPRSGCVDSERSSFGLFAMSAGIGAGLQQNFSKEDEPMVEKNNAPWMECESSDDELIRPTNTNKF